MPRRKYQSREFTIADAVSYAFDEINSLAEEVREVVDNTEGTGLRNTNRIETLDDTASTLESLSEPDVPKFFEEIKINVSEIVGKILSRRSRIDNALSAMESIIETATEWIDAHNEEQYENLRDEAQTFLDEIESAKDDADGVELPGMYG